MFKVISSQGYTMGEVLKQINNDKCKLLIIFKFLKIIL